MVVTQQLVREVAAETGAHHQSVTRRIAGLPVQGAAGRAIDRALRERGIVPPDLEQREDGG